MVKKVYQVQGLYGKKTARAMMKNKPVSLKYSLEIISNIKGNRVEKALAFLHRIANKQEFLPLRKYKKKIGHRKGQAKGFTKVGRYPLRTVKAFIELLESVKSNADFRGLDSENLIILHMFASQGFQRLSYQSQGRISGKRRKKKSAHIEIIVQETA
ncbi:MAG TPA: 50S ribosomal protein L22 [archaeon]|nr:50S ribosomal protein L22P [uncultured archaeon]HZX33946.1 50S ribosomal protein L22 [archaeon]